MKIPTTTSSVVVVVVVVVEIFAEYKATQLIFNIVKPPLQPDVTI